MDDDKNSIDETTEKKELRRKQVHHAVLAAIAFIVLITFGIAWFVNNTRVSGTGVEVKSEGARFELATVGADPNAYSAYDPTPAIVGDLVNFEDSEKKYYATSGPNNSISWMVGADSNLNNNAQVSLQPESNGSLSFSVLPKVKDLGTLQFTLKIIPYTDGVEGDADSVTIDGKFYTPLVATDDAYKLLKGHLLFFDSYSQTGRYGDLLDLDTPFENSKLDPDMTSVEDSHLDYTIHWVWPGWFRQYVNRGKDSLFSDDLSMDIPYNNMITKINANKAAFFKTSGINDTIPDVTSNMSSIELDAFSDYYNNGDEFIGRKVRFVQLVLTAWES